MIQTKDLTKKFGTFTAVDDLNIQLNPGEIYGLLGPNGAGKTTTLLMILGLLEPTHGEVIIFGKRLSEDPFPIKHRIGVVPEKQSFYDEMTTSEYLAFFAELYGVQDSKTRAQYLLERVQLWEWRNALIGEFSAGMRRKLGLVRALLHSPEILILDEPVSNLDPFGIVQVREILNEERRAGRTILLSSHILSEVEQTVDRVGIINHGRLMTEDSMDNLRQKTTGQRRIHVELDEYPEDILQNLRDLPYILDIQLEGQEMIVFTADDRDYRADLGRILSEKGVIVQGLHSVEITLEEAFIKITDERVREWTRTNHDH